MVIASRTATGLLCAALLSALLLLLGPAAAGAKQAAVAQSSGHHADLASARSWPAQPLPHARRNLSGLRARPQRRRLQLRLARCQPQAPKAAASAATGPLYWGAWIGDQLTGDEAPWDMGAVEKFEGMAGKRPRSSTSPRPSPTAPQPLLLLQVPRRRRWTAIRAHGSIPFFSWASQATPASLNQPDFQLADVIDGSHDAYIREFAEAATRLGPPLLPPLQLGDERRLVRLGRGRQRQPGRRVRRRLAPRPRHLHRGRRHQRDLGLVPQRRPRRKLQDLAPLYPGDEYVDWTGLDGYNWGTNPARPTAGAASTTSSARPTTRSPARSRPRKPLIVSEVGSTEYGGSKAAWIADALESAATNYPQLRGLLWFEKFDDGMDWPIETSSSSAGAFAAGIQSPSYLGNRSPPSPGARSSQPG